jgi:hypothetical protein
LATVVINLSSWEMIITPPFHFSRASMRASKPFKTFVRSMVKGAHEKTYFNVEMIGGLHDDESSFRSNAEKRST